VSDSSTPYTTLAAASQPFASGHTPSPRGVLCPRREWVVGMRFRLYVCEETHEFNAIILFNQNHSSSTTPRASGAFIASAMKLRIFSLPISSCAFSAISYCTSSAPSLLRTFSLVKYLRPNATHLTTSPDAPAYQTTSATLFPHLCASDLCAVRVSCSRLPDHQRASRLSRPLSSAHTPRLHQVLQLHLGVAERGVHDALLHPQRVQMLPQLPCSAPTPRRAVLSSVPRKLTPTSAAKGDSTPSLIPPSFVSTTQTNPNLSCEGGQHTVSDTTS
jgi:hypothetical protein